VLIHYLIFSFFPFFIALRLYMQFDNGKRTQSDKTMHSLPFRLACNNSYKKQCIRSWRIVDSNSCSLLCMKLDRMYSYNLMPFLFYHHSCLTFTHALVFTSSTTIAFTFQHTITATTYCAVYCTLNHRIVHAPCLTGQGTCAL
jgi:hypothetical protein